VDSPRSAVASPLHTALVVMILAGWAGYSALRSAHARAQGGNLLLTYGASMLLEAALFTVVVWGARWREIFGPRKGAAQLWRDIGVAIVFWLASAIALSILSKALGAPSTIKNLAYLLPRTTPEKIMWVLLSITAGVCEETIFRGYLQRQFEAFSRSALLGIVLSATLFGAGHIYQGPRPALVIGCYGAMFSALAYWRKSIRPGIFAHAWQDSLAGLLANMLEKLPRA
jgi:membrane protease YdiL (CAAX protease family)